MYNLFDDDITISNNKKIDFLKSAIGADDFLEDILAYLTREEKTDLLDYILKMNDLQDTFNKEVQD